MKYRDITFKSHEADCVEHFQTSYRGNNTEEGEDTPSIPTVDIIFPAKWRRRIKRASKAYVYSKVERLEYNENQHRYGKEYATAVANDKWRKRDVR